MSCEGLAAALHAAPAAGLCKRQMKRHEPMTQHAVTALCFARCIRRRSRFALRQCTHEQLVYCGRRLHRKSDIGLKCLSNSRVPTCVSRERRTRITRCQKGRWSGRLPQALPSCKHGYSTASQLGITLDVRMVVGPTMATHASSRLRCLEFMICKQAWVYCNLSKCQHSNHDRARARLHHAIGEYQWQKMGW